MTAQVRLHSPEGHSPARASGFLEDTAACIAKARAGYTVEGFPLLWARLRQDRPVGWARRVGRSHKPGRGAKAWREEAQTCLPRGRPRAGKGGGGELEASSTAGRGLPPPVSSVPGKGLCAGGNRSEESDFRSPSGLCWVKEKAPSLSSPKLGSASCYLFGK